MLKRYWIKFLLLPISALTILAALITVKLHWSLVCNWYTISVYNINLLMRNLLFVSGTIFGLITLVLLLLALYIFCIIKKNKKQNFPAIEKTNTQSSTPKLPPEVDPEIKTKLILYSSINKKISLFPLKATLDAKNPIKSVFKMLLASYYHQPNKKDFKKFSDDINEYNILDVSNKSWIEPEYADELNNKMIAFVPASSDDFEYLKITSKAKVISFTIESFLK